jgi:hypothetical protein
MRQAIRDLASTVLIAFGFGVAGALIVVTIGGWFYTVVRVGQWAIENTNLLSGIALGVAYAITTLFLGAFLGVIVTTHLTDYGRRDPSQH